MLNEPRLVGHFSDEYCTPTEYPNGRVLNTLLSTVHVLHEPSNPEYLRTLASYRHNSYVARRTFVGFGVSTFVHVHTVFSTLLVLTNLSEEGKAATTTITIAQKQCFSVNELWLIDFDILIFVRHHFILPTRVDEHKTSSPSFCSSHFGPKIGHFLHLISCSVNHRRLQKLQRD